MAASAIETTLRAIGSGAPPEGRAVTGARRIATRALTGGSVGPGGSASRFGGGAPRWRGGEADGHRFPPPDGRRSGRSGAAR